MSQNISDVKEYFYQLGYSEGAQVALRTLPGRDYPKTSGQSITCTLGGLDFDRLCTQNDQDNHRSVYALPNGAHNLALTASVRAIAFEWDDDLPKDESSVLDLLKSDLEKAGKS